MHCFITGAGGMLGRKLARALIVDPRVHTLTLTDIAAPDIGDLDPSRIKRLALDIRDAGQVAEAISSRPDIVVHLAGVVSAEAEEDFEKGYAVNLTGLVNTLETLRQQCDASSKAPRFVFASSLAVFGDNVPDLIEDDHRPSPKSSYGTQKALGEMLVADYSRKGYVDGLSLRLPTIAVRPGAPNKAASGFYSSIIREPMHGKEAILPVGLNQRHWLQSPRMAVRNLAHACFCLTGGLPTERTLNLPGVSVTVEEMIEALRKNTCEATAGLIRHKPDPAIEKIVGGWPRAFNPALAGSLGFVGDRDFTSIINVYREDDLR